MALAEGAGFLWVANSLDSTVSKVDPTSGSVAATIPVGSGPSAIAAADGLRLGREPALGDGLPHRSGPRTPSRRPSPSAGGPTALDGRRRADLGRAPAPARAASRRHADAVAHTLDLDRSCASASICCRRWPTASRATASSPTTTSPGRPESSSSPTSRSACRSRPTDGRTYTFRLRPGIRYSDGRLVRARPTSAARSSASFACTRTAPTLLAVSWARTAAADAHLRPRTGHRHRRRVRGLSRSTSALRTPDFLAKLTVGGFAAPVPPGTPFRDSRLARRFRARGRTKSRAASGREIRYVRNPLFREWSHAAQPAGNPDEIVVALRAPPTREVTRSSAGRADWMNDGIPPVAPRGARRALRRARCIPNATTETDFFQLNTHRAAVRRRPRAARAQPRDRPPRRSSASTAGRKAATADLPGAASGHTRLPVCTVPTPRNLRGREARWSRRRARAATA